MSRKASQKPQPRALSTVCQDLHAQSRALPYRPTQPQQSHRLAATLLHSLLSLFLSFTSHSTTSSSIGPQHCLSCSPLTKGDNQLALLLSSLQQHSNKLAPTLLSSAFRLPPPPSSFRHSGTIWACRVEQGFTLKYTVMPDVQKSGHTHLLDI